MDYYLKFLLHFCTNEYCVTINIEKFIKGMNKSIKYSDSTKTKAVLEYIQNNVLSFSSTENPKKWGDYLKELRDKTAHQKIIRPTIKQKENFYAIPVSWPTINGIEIAELLQLNVENKVVTMIHELFPILFGFSWITGPYKPGMYDSTPVSEE